jgi:hypothetical protein
LIDMFAGLSVPSASESVLPSLKNERVLNSIRMEA